jgi:hypothetical protein
MEQQAADAAEQQAQLPEGTVTGQDLLALGTVYSVAQASEQQAAGAQGGSTPGEAVATTESAFDLDVTGLPYFWVLVRALLAGSLAAGLLLRWVRFKNNVGGRARSRLEG